jgi:hypothetical protein
MASSATEKEPVVFGDADLSKLEFGNLKQNNGKEGCVGARRASG